MMPGLFAVTGSSGLLGSNLVLDLADAGYDVVALRGQHAVSFAGVPFYSHDLRDRRQTAELLTWLRPAWIIHAAAATNVEWCEQNPEECMRINAHGPGTVAAIARSIGAGVVYISTDAVFDGRAGGYRETDAISPLNAYGRAKAAGEQAVLRELPESLIIRTNIYGWNAQPKASLAEWILNRLEARQVTPGFADVFFSPLLVNDVSRYILELVRLGSVGIYHLGASEHCSKYDFAMRVADVFGLDPALVSRSSLEKSNLAAPRPLHTWLRSERATSALERPLASLREGLERFRDLRESGFAARLKASVVQQEEILWRS